MKGKESEDAHRSDRRRVLVRVQVARVLPIVLPVRRQLLPARTPARDQPSPADRVRLAHAHDRRADLRVCAQLHRELEREAVVRPAEERHEQAVRAAVRDLRDAPGGVSVDEERDVGARGREQRAHELRVRDRRVALLRPSRRRAEQHFERVLHV